MTVPFIFNNATSPIALSQLDENFASVSTIYNVLSYGAVGDGVTDDTLAIQAAIDAAGNSPSGFGGTVWFPAGDYRVSQQIRINKPFVNLHGERGSRVLAVEGNYIVFYFVSGSYWNCIDSLRIEGTRTTSLSQLTLVRVTGNSAYFTIRNCGLAFCSTAIYIGQTYIVKILYNSYSGCDYCIDSTTAEGSTADMLIQGNTFGTNLFGTNPMVNILFNDVRINDNYFEEQGLAKQSIRIKTGTQRAVINANQFNDTGGVQIETSNFVVLSNNTFRNSYDSVNNRCIRLDGGATAQIFCNYFTNTAGIPASNPTCISSSGMALLVGNYFEKWATVASTLDGVVADNIFSNNTTGFSSAGGNTMRLINNNLFIANTTDILATSGNAMIFQNYATTLTDSTGFNPIFANYPRRAGLRELYGQTTWNPGNIGVGGSASTTVSVTGAVVGDYVDIGLAVDLQGMSLSGYVSSSNTVTAVLQNNTSGGIDLADSTLYVLVRKAT